MRFESFVNSERCKTRTSLILIINRLRALLIQKDVKPTWQDVQTLYGLRALLIQKDVKLFIDELVSVKRLRALLIQKDVKQGKKDMNWQSV